MTKRLWFLAPAVLAAAAVLPVHAATAGGSTPAEAGCYDILGSSKGTLSPVLRSATQTGKGNVLDPYTEVKKEYYPDARAAEVSVVLAAPSCVDATYSLQLFDVGASKPFRTVTIAGDGVSGTADKPLSLLALIDHTTASCVETVLQVSSGKTVVDTAPDTGTVAVCLDGGAQGYGG